MDKDEKIKNAAKYWYECEKEGFPKSQKEVFKEWLKKDIRHNKAYKELKDICIESEVKIQNIQEETKESKDYLIYFLPFCILLLVLFLLIIIYY